MCGGDRTARPKPTYVDAAKLLGILVSYFVLAGFAGWARERSTAAGLIATFGADRAFTGLWLWTTTQLPHRDAGVARPRPRRDEVGVGLGDCQFAAAYLLGPDALQKEGTYGALGLAAAMLLSLWAVGRLFIGGAEINATLWERKQRGIK